MDTSEGLFQLILVTGDFWITDLQGARSVQRNVGGPGKSAHPWAEVQIMRGRGKPVEVAQINTRNVLAVLPFYG
jgi:hypothetical protein